MGDLPNDAIGFPYRSHFGSETGGALTASSLMTGVTSGAAHTKGAWTQMIASTAEDSGGLLLISPYIGVYAGWDIGIGAAGSETVLVSNLYWGAPGNAIPNWILIPVFIKKGTRIAMRFQDSGGGSTVTAGVVVLKTPVSGQNLRPVAWPTVAPTIGESAGYITATSLGTLLTCSASANTKGAYAQLIASTSKRTVCLIVGIGNTIAGDQHYLIDISTGAAASEVVLVANLCIWYSADQITVGTIPVMIPPGTRLAARAQCNLAGSKTCKCALVLLEVN